MGSRDLRALSCITTASLTAVCLACVVVTPPRAAHADEAPTFPAQPDTVRPDTVRPDTVRPAPAAPAEEAPRPPAEQAPRPSTPVAPSPPAKPGDSLDFDLFGEPASAKGGATGAAAATGATLPSGKQVTRDPLVIARQVKKRRLMLQLHQGFGFATLAVFAATIVVGQLNYIDKFGGGDYTDRYDRPHLGLAATTTALFATDGILALAAPNPYPKPIRVDAALLHKVMMGIATAGMLTEIALGFVSESKAGELQQRDLALGHLVNGYVTFAAMATGYLAYVF